MINLENLEIFSQAHQMYAEGIEDEKPAEAEIQQAILTKGFISRNIEVSFDALQGYWRWYCDISPNVR